MKHSIKKLDFLLAEDTFMSESVSNSTAYKVVSEPISSIRARPNSSNSTLNLKSWRSNELLLSLLTSNRTLKMSDSYLALLQSKEHEGSFKDTKLKSKTEPMSQPLD